MEYTFDYANVGAGYAMIYILPAIFALIMYLTIKALIFGVKFGTNKKIAKANEAKRAALVRELSQV